MPRDNKAIALIWLKRARSNLVRASLSKPADVYWEDLCFDAQQCVEKSLKALLIFNGIKFRFVHDIAELLKSLKKNNIFYPDEINESVILTDYAVETRYPLLIEPLTEKDYDEAIKITVRVFNGLQGKLVYSHHPSKLQNHSNTHLNF